MKMRYIKIFFILSSFFVYSISQAELSVVTTGVNEKKKADFKKDDVNGDGSISFEELQQGQKLRHQKYVVIENKKTLLKCDKDKNSLIGAEELLDENELRLRMSSGDENFSIRKSCILAKSSVPLLDINKDGFIDLNELIKPMTSDMLTSTKDRKVALKRKGQRRQKMFKSCDANTDQSLTWREVFSRSCGLSLSSEGFDTYDTNSDSQLTLKEVGAAIRVSQYPSYMDERTLKERKAMPRRDLLALAVMECDANNDERLTKTEVTRKYCIQDMAFFDQVDANQDGSIDKKEINRMYEKHEYDRMDKNKNGLLDLSEYE